MAHVGIVIVTYNSTTVIDACLNGVVNSGAEIVVIDNASSDNTVAVAARPGVRVVANSTNVGFAAAVNQGFSLLACPYVLLLNPDTVLQSGLEPLRAACDLPRAAGASGILLSCDGKPQVGFMVREFPTPTVLILESLLLNRLWPGNPLNRDYRGLTLDYSKRQAVEQPAGAFLMIRRDAWEQLGGLDEGFWPLWFEDVDFCRRAADREYRWYFVPDAVAKHTGAHSIVKLPVESRRVYWYGSLLRYSAKHFSACEVRMVCAAVMLGSVLRMVGELTLKRSMEPFRTYRKVFQLAVRYFFGQMTDSRSSVF
ncbi:MAG TPA: glycosyltransferase family 2 protein [Bryobacteraceae bacterium]|jgi:GT2 family glycosyltransferase